jgi:hypothetical protein
MFTCHTGGAEGADSEFECESLVNGFTVKAYLPIGFHCPQTHDTLCAEYVNTNDPECCDALLSICMDLKEMSHPQKPWLQSIVKRNYYQIKDSDGVFAVAPLVKNRQTKKLYKVKGGTRYAVFMGIKKGIPVYVFHKKYWHKWVEDEFKILSPQASANLSVPHSFTGIGSRDLKDEGVIAIRKLIQNSIKKKNKRQLVLEERPNKKPKYTNPLV